MKVIKKAQTGVKATKDSTAYFKNKEKSFRQLSKSEKSDTEVSKFNKRFFENEAGKAVSSQLRQSHKGAPGYDANGYPINKKKAKSGTTIAKAKGGKWIQKATASIKRRGTEGVCTGAKFGGPTCKPGTRRYNLAKTFKAMGKARKGK